ncbi:MAG: hypothetical protein JXM70_12260, partial [Pirellulales bacterium]|nr:hypothetical protein [Pirellulales bacterium]
ENSYPSGFAGGLVPEAMPDSRGHGLHFHEVEWFGKLAENIAFVYQAVDGGFSNITKQALAGKEFPKGRYLLGEIREAPNSGWYGGKYYVDLIKPGVTEKFIEITMGAYERELGQHFGKRIPGVFTDEPRLAPAHGLHWSDRVARDFKKRWGYDLIEHLPSMVTQVGDWRKVRHDYQQFLLEELIEHWAKPNYEYCEKHGLEFTGHYWEHNWPGAKQNPDSMALYAWHQRPAIDNLMNKYGEDTHGQFGNARTVKELSSVANQMGRRRTLCETYGAGGWDLRFEDMKRIGDWIYVLGVNTLNEHLSYITIRGARKRDHPQSFSYHTPWWEAYHKMADHFTRLSLFLSEGRQINHVLLLEPTTTVWMYQPDGSTRDQLYQVANAFQDMVNSLEQVQAEYDLGSEDIIARHGSTDGPRFVVGKCAYDLVVFSPHTENLNPKTVELLEKYLAAGGKVICCGEPPSRIDGKASSRAAKLADNASWKKASVEDAIAAMRKLSQDGLAIRRAEGDKGKLFHHRRRLDDGDFLFLVNTSITDPSSGSIDTSAKGIQRWDLNTGKIEPYTFTKTGDGTNAKFTLPPCGSLALFLSKMPCEAASAETAKIATIRPLGPSKISRVGPNVLTLDYVDVKVGGESKKNMYFYGANKLIFQKHGFDGNPWDSAVQFRDTLITKKFPTDSGFTASYHFNIKGPVPKPLYIVIERSDLYEITCNGRPVAAEEGQWWLDKSFGKVDISRAAKTGENIVTIKASPMTMYHELEPAYVLGEFALEPAKSGFTIVPPRPMDMKQRKLHGTTPDGFMWLSAGVNNDSSKPTDRDPYLVFDLGRPRDLAVVKIWNYNEVNLTKRGIKQLDILVSPTGKPDSFKKLGTYTLDEANNPSDSSRGAGSAQMLNLAAENVRFVKFDILSNHNGDTYPQKGKTLDNAYVGLSKVRFMAKGKGQSPTIIPGVTVAKVSSELTSGVFNRRAEHLVAGGGMERGGWNLQGYPFYAQGVSYTETFDVPQPDGQYRVSLPSWNGSVAKVLVNGQMADYITCQPWECDVTKLIKPCKNTVEVIVIGTLRNTLGPHHSGHLVGQAWPHAFQKGPITGPPPGNRYDTLGYGLFEPFVLKQLRK